MNDTRSQKRVLNPRLRFPEFWETGEWEAKNIEEIFTVTRGEVLSMGLVSEDRTTDKPYPVYSSQTKNNGLAGYYSEYLYEDAITWTTDGANAGDVNYRAGKFYCTNVCGVLISNGGYANPCIAALINSVARNYVSYVGNPKLMNGVMAKINIPIPSLEEQRRIGDFLCSIDELISAETQKADALKAHKEGLIQQLLPAPDETVPRLRFPEFRDRQGWEERQLFEFITEMESGASVNSYDFPVSGRQDLGVLKTSCIAGGTFFPHENKTIIEEERTFAKASARKNTVLVSRMNTPSLVGESGYVAADYPNLFLPDRLWMISCNESVILTRFFSLILASERMRASIGRAATGTSATMKNVSKPSFLGLKLHAPMLDEQRKITDLLDNLDQLITAQLLTLKAFKVYKKGFLRQLLAITGGVEE